MLELRPNCEPCDRDLAPEVADVEVDVVLAADPPPALAVGPSTHSIEVGGVSRTYIVYRPASLPAAAPLVVMLHGGSGRASQAEKSYGWDTEADRGH